MQRDQTDRFYQVLRELVIDFAVDDRGYIPSPNLVAHSIGLGREEVLATTSLFLTWCVAGSWTHLASVHLVYDDAKRPHVHRAGKGRLGVLDEQLGSLVRVSPAFGVEDTLVEWRIFAALA